MIFFCSLKSTGYRPIVDAVKACPCGLTEGGCCQNEGEQQPSVAEAPVSGEFILPPFLRLNKPGDLVVEGPHSTFVRPTSFVGLQKAMEKFHGKFRVIGGATSIRILSHSAPGTVFISAALVPELKEMHLSFSGTLQLGASVTLRETLQFLQEGGSDEQRFFPHSPVGALLQLLPEIGSSQVRGAATWGGALALCEPNSDLIAFLAVVGAEVHVTGSKKSHTITMEQLISGPYKSSISQGHEMITSLVRKKWGGEALVSFFFNRLFLLLLRCLTALHTSSILAVKQVGPLLVDLHI